MEIKEIKDYVNRWLYLKERGIWVRDDYKMHVPTSRIDMSKREIAEEVEDGILRIMTLEESERRTLKVLQSCKSAAVSDDGIYGRNKELKKAVAEINKKIIEVREEVEEPKEEPVEEIKEFIPKYTDVNRTEQKLSRIWVEKAEKLKNVELEKPKKKKKHHKRHVNKDLRAEILKRDHYHCCMCGSRERLQVHHIKYMSKGGTDDQDNLITLCEACHYEIHKNEPVGKIMKKHLES